MGGVLQAAGEAARAIETVSWVLIAGALAIFLGVMALLAMSLRRQAGPVRTRWWIVGGGLVFPGVVLAALFAWTVPMTPARKAAPPPHALVITVTGHLWWWDVRYRDPSSGKDVRSANEIRIPFGRPVYLALDSADVIHSFWVPQLAGKMDMIPGRMQHLLVSAPGYGVFRGQCAEFCGEQHARMALDVVAVSPAEFDDWLARQAAPAAAPQTPQQEQGQRAFLANRCDACHAVRGVTADARLGPDLTHLASRMHLGARTLPNTRDGRREWIAHVQRVKSGARMPSYERLQGPELEAIVEWLGALR